MDRINQQKVTPLYDAILKYNAQSRLSLHTPGHKQGRLIPNVLQQQSNDSLWQYDVTEVEGLDNLLSPSGVIKCAEDLTARHYGVANTLFSTQGSTSGLLAALLALVKPGQKVLLPRNAHVSLINGMVLADAVPVFMPVYQDDAKGIIYGVTEATLSTTLAEHPDLAAVILVHPSYDGFCADIAKMVLMGHKHGVPVIVDEAHGAHLHLHKQLPISAVKAGADIIVQSAHKTLPALTGGAWVHVQGERVCASSLRQSMNLVHSTSPSYLIMASLDACRHLLHSSGKQLMQQLLEKLDCLRAAINRLTHIKEIPIVAPFQRDPTKLLISVSHSQGSYWAEYLTKHHGIYVEKSMGQTLLFLFGIADINSDFDLLLQALVDMDKKTHALQAQEQKHTQLPTFPPTTLKMQPRQVYFATKRWLLLEEAVGKISSQPVVSCPPGIPILLPGEVISKEIVEFLVKDKQQGKNIEGVRETNSGIEVQVVAT